jgi:hypothetical protein
MPFEVPVKATTLGTFAAIRPSTRAGAASISALAAGALRELHWSRARPHKDERERRLASGLTPRQVSLLDEWGYPYVLEEFRFHITVSDSCARDEREAIANWWAARIPALGPLVVDSVALFVEARPGDDLMLAARFSFGGAV